MNSILPATQRGKDPPLGSFVLVTPCPFISASTYIFYPHNLCADADIQQDGERPQRILPRDHKTWILFKALAGRFSAGTGWVLLKSFSTFLLVYVPERYLQVALMVTDNHTALSYLCQEYVCHAVDSKTNQSLISSVNSFSIILSVYTELLKPRKCNTTETAVMEVRCQKLINQGLKRQLQSRQSTINTNWFTC